MKFWLLLGSLAGLVGPFAGPAAAGPISSLTDDLGDGAAVTPPPNTWLSTLAPPQRASLHWIGDWETGNTSQWDNGQPWVSGPGISSWQLVPAPAAHSGLFAMSTTIDTTLGTAGIRWPRRNVPDSNTFHTAAYYSTWLRLDAPIDADWFNVMQWKHVTADGTSSDPVYTINIDQRPDGRDYLYLFRHVGNDGNYNTPGMGRAADSAIPLPIGQWVHLEAYYAWASDNTGKIAVYQDGRQIFQKTGVRTKFVHPDAATNPMQWTVNAFGQNVVPSPTTILFDDAAISGLRLGSGLSALQPGDFNDDGRV
ncbi:MAG: heparin lyase I family protein, partial [Pirellulales bacterium]